MKKITLLLVLWLVNYELPFCQVYSNKVSKDTIGYFYKTPKSILADRTFFNTPIVDVSNDSLKKRLLINFEKELSLNKGYFGVMAYSLDSLLWLLITRNI